MALGKVYLVGAGPGDPELMTLRGAERLRNADCVVYDRLIDPRILDLAPECAERIYVGKQPGGKCHVVPQEQINALLIEQAQRGRIVVRLKGGDPLLFARGGEEACALRQAGIEYEIVPGVTAALAASATAGIPLTHRSLSSAVALITGHEDPAKADGLDWSSLAKFPGTLVVYMGLTRFPAIAAELIAHGRDPATPVHFIEWGGTNRQRVEKTDLGRAARVASGLSSPVITIVGIVGDLRDRVAWLERRPLFGIGVLLPQPPASAAILAPQLEAAGAVTYCGAAFDIAAIDDTALLDAVLHQLEAYDWIVFTSRNGVRFFLDHLLGRGGDLRQLGAAKLAAIGPGTAEALRNFHLVADLLPESFRAEELAAALAPNCRDQRVLLVRANRGREVLETSLVEAGATVDRVVVYRQVDQGLAPEIHAALAEGRIGCVMLSSGNIARGFLGGLDEKLAEKVRREVVLVSISPVTTAAIVEAGFQAGIEAEQYTFAGMVDALCRQRSKFFPGLQALPDQ